MLNIRLGIIGNDIYTINLMKYINSNYNDMKILAFTDINKVEEYLRNDSMEGLVICNYVNKDDIKKFDVKSVFLSEQRNEDDNSLYKYQALDIIYQKLKKYFCYSENENGEIDRLVAVYSPVGRSGKSKLAIDLCNQKSNSIYIGWENYSGMIKDEVSEKYFDQFMFYLAEENAKIINLLEEIIHSGNKFIRKEYCVDDVKCIDRKMVRWLREMLNACEEKINLTIDIGIGCINDYKIFEEMDKVYVPILQDEVSKRKLGSFKNYIKKNGVKSNKFYYVDEARNIYRF